MGVGLKLQFQKQNCGYEGDLGRRFGFGAGGNPSNGAITDWDDFGCCQGFDRRFRARCNCHGDVR